MSPRSKREYIEAIFLRYRKAPHKEKTIILDEFCATCRYHRKHAIRLLRRFKRFIKPKTKKRGRATTKPGTLLRKHVPIKTNQWDESRPGFLEADTVAHCGESLSGMFAYTIDCVNIATGWSEQRAIWGKGETAVLEQIKKEQIY
jgi:hypothetical protein